MSKGNALLKSSFCFEKKTSNPSCEERMPLSSIPRRSRKRNPFKERQRNNFPEIDDAFRIDTNNKNNNDNYNYNDSASNIFDNESDFDTFSEVEGSSSVLNMSIGARAALNEHARHVEKFGIDGEKKDSDEEVYTGSDTNLFLDDQWDTLLEPSSHVGSCAVGDISFENNNITIISKFNKLYLAEEKLGHDESIEVMTDVSRDYFNSSRVNQLTTPERNKNSRIRPITRNGEDIYDDDVFGQDGPCFGIDHHPSCYDDEANRSDYNHNDCRNISSSSQISMHEDSRVDSQCSSFNVGDISRISNNTISDTNNTDTSFQDHGNYGLRINDDDYSFSPTTIGTTHTSSKSNDTQRPELHFNSSTTASRRDKDEKKSVESSGRNKNKTFDNNDISLSSVQSTFSNFVTEAQLMAEQIAHDVEQSLGSIESLQEGFLRALNISPPSPISQVGSSTPSTSQSRVLGKEKRNDETNDEKSLSLDSSSNDTGRIFYNRNNASSELTGRKRYRTVVPRRVYLMDHQQTQRNFGSDEQDSFGVRSNPEAIAVRVPPREASFLLESFDENATFHTY